MRTAIALTLSTALLAPLSGCPKRFDPASHPGFPAKAAPAAKSRFQAARAQFENDEFEAAAREFEAIRKEFPDDPIVPYALLYEGMAALRGGDPDTAVATLTRVVEDPAAGEDVKKRARFFLGVGLAQTGKHAEARVLLEPYVGKLEKGEERGELHAALAESAADAATALKYWDDFWPDARPAERVYVASRVRATVEGMPEDAARAAYGRADKKRVAAAFLGRRLAAAARAARDPGLAQRILDETADARAAAGLRDDETAGTADVNLVGGLVSLTGKRRLLGEAVMRGMSLAAGTYDRTPGAGVADDGVPRPFQIVAEDRADDETSATGVDALEGQGVVAIIGPVSAKAAVDASRRATDLAVPIIMLDSTEGTTESPFVFRVMVTAEDRARALAGKAYALGARRFAVLAPEIAYGTRAAKAFRDEVERLGGTVAVEITYAKDATQFVSPVGKIAKEKIDALFVPDTAARLELIAPQLAVDNLIVQPRTAKKPRRGQPILLLSTAEGIAPKFLKGSGRYANGALFAPAFYPDEKDERIGRFVGRFRAAFGEWPTALDAYAYDAALLVRAAVEAGARDRGAVAASLAAARLHGLTGEIHFDATRGRADRGVLFECRSDGAGAFEIRAVR